MALERIRITGGRRLEGEIQIAGAKNATLPILAATILTPETCTLSNVPNLKDVESMIGILESLGVDVQSSQDGELQLSAKELTSSEAPYNFVRKMRASVLLLGPLLARNGTARVALPGGCAIGVRPIDQHLKALKTMGAEIELKDGYIEAKATRLIGAKFHFDRVSVTGTMNAMFAASKAKGQTALQNCAREPEVTALADALRGMGVKLEGAGTQTITLEGVSSYGSFQEEMIPDRIATGTYLVASAMTNGDVFVRKAKAEDLQAVLGKLKDCGAEITVDANGIRLRHTGPIRPINIQTSPHPGFPTDMQAQFMALLSIAEGTSTITETIFENRFMHVAELKRMGANLRIGGSMVTVEGVKCLHGAPVMATDLRASASLVLAGLAAKGDTEVLRIYHLDRGYEKMDAKLRELGADIERIQ